MLRISIINSNFKITQSGSTDDVVFPLKLESQFSFYEKMRGNWTENTKRFPKEQLRTVKFSVGSFYWFKWRNVNVSNQ